jgi:hypothetical protein
MEGLMSVYVVRLNDGSCLIEEADSESQAREEFVSRWNSSGSEPEELILSIREMPKGTFLSRWWPSEYASDEGLLPGQLDGGISDDSDVYEKEYPIIEAAHKKASRTMAAFSDDTPIEPTVLEWDAKLRDSLTEAVRAEMRRGNIQTNAIQ